MSRVDEYEAEPERFQLDPPYRWRDRPLWLRVIVVCAIAVPVCSAMILAGLIFGARE